MEQNIDKKFLFFQIILFETETVNSDSSEQDTFYWQSMSYEAPLRQTPCFLF